jgi:hypothetical protein
LCARVEVVLKDAKMIFEIGLFVFVLVPRLKCESEEKVKMRWDEINILDNVKQYVKTDIYSGCECNLVV